MWTLLVSTVLLLSSSWAQQVLNIPEDERCSLQDGTNGTCTRESDCFRLEVKSQQICSESVGDTIICCPDHMRFGIVWRYCNYIERHLHSHKAQPYPAVLIIGGGIMSSMIRRPYSALIGYGPEENIQWSCGGSLINSRFILSAAHCAEMDEDRPARWVRLGSLHAWRKADEESHPQEREIVETFVPPNYDPTKSYHDIALFRLNEPVDFTPWVSPVCLNTIRDLEGFSSAVATGWGRVEFAGALSPVLLEAELDLFDDEDCAGYYNTTDPKIPRGVDPDLMFCAGKLDGSKDTCPGDSGGPLVVDTAGTYHKQIGVVSAGKMCLSRDSPGLYTRLSAYVPWIERIAFDGEHIPELAFQ